MEVYRIMGGIDTEPFTHVGNVKDRGHSFKGEGLEVFFYTEW